MAPPIKHGVRSLLSARQGGAWRHNKSLKKFRDALEAEVAARLGEVDLYRAALIQSASRHEGVAALWSNYLKTHSRELGVAERLQICREVRNATDARDRCLREMGLSKPDAENAIDAIYARPIEPEEAEHGTGA